MICLCHFLQKVYWSDVHERSIHVANLDGSDHHLFLTANESLGIVDGMALDVKGSLYDIETSWQC